MNLGHNAKPSTHLPSREFVVVDTSTVRCLPKVECPKGHYCKRGSSRPTRCPPLMTCPAGSDAPSGNTAGPQRSYIDGILVNGWEHAICH